MIFVFQLCSFREQVGLTVAVNNSQEKKKKDSFQSFHTGNNSYGLVSFQVNSAHCNLGKTIAALPWRSDIFPDISKIFISPLAIIPLYVSSLKYLLLLLGIKSKTNLQHERDGVKMKASSNAAGPSQ